MTPEEINKVAQEMQALTPAQRDELAHWLCGLPGKTTEVSREPSLVRAELVDALHDYADIFREKARMELQRAEAVDVVANKVENGGSAEQPDIAQSQAFEREQGLLHMRFQELQMRVNRLIIEHGNN